MLIGQFKLITIPHYQELLDPSPSHVKLGTANKRGGMGLAGQTKFNLTFVQKDVVILTNWSLLANISDCASGDSVAT